MFQIDDVLAVLGRAHCLLKICRRHVITSSASIGGRLKTRKLDPCFRLKVEFTAPTQSEPGINCVSRAMAAFSEYHRKYVPEGYGTAAPDNFHARSLANNGRMSKLVRNEYIQWSVLRYRREFSTQLTVLVFTPCFAF